MHNEHETFPESVLSEIRDRGIAPIPRWQFLASRTFAWVLAGLSVAVGGVAFSIAEFVFFDNDGPARLHGSSLEDIAQSIPFVWLAFVGFFALVAYYGFRQTRHGYRYATAWVVGIVVASSVAFGLILNAADLGQAVYQALPGPAAPSVDGSD